MRIRQGSSWCAALGRTVATTYNRSALIVRAGVIDMLKIVRTSEGHEPWTFATLLRTPAPEREDLTPIEWMRDSDQDQRALRDLALRWVHEWSR